MAPGYGVGTDDLSSVSGARWRLDTVRARSTMKEDAVASRDDELTPEEMRREELLAAPKAQPEDAAPRIDVTKRDGVTRIDVRDDAVVRPGDPTREPDER
jgi:hypothetical protein